MIQIDCEIISNKQISEKCFLITFLGNKITNEIKPGQFVMVYDTKTFLRRPFSVCDVSEKNFSIVFKVVGTGTKILSQKKAGDIVNIICPLGTGFLLPITSYNLPHIIVAGGTGVASLFFLTQYLSTYQYINMPPVVFIGAKTKTDILFENEFKKLGCKVIISTEDGSYGLKGLITDALIKFLLSIRPASHTLHPTVYACGPSPMLKKIAEICKNKKLKCYASLEEKMACGFGACAGCTIKIKSEKCKTENKDITPYTYKRVCKDGPVFDIEEIVW
ncbi:MAG: dihydroorotate dehydrogenase electron transfer subunit [Elusimicrobiota bacterium]